MQHNPRDPMNNIGPQKERALFERLNDACDGFDVATVVAASLNVFINAMRTAHGTRQDAERAFNEHMGRAKGVLLDQHYDPVTNKRRNIFPFTQHVHAELVHWDPKKNR